MSAACSFTGKTHGLVWHLTPAGYPACTGGIAPILSASAALALFSTCTLTCQLLYNFRNYRGLYFWSLAITSWSLSIHVIGQVLMYVDGSKPWYLWRLYSAILYIGWICMTTGFSMVLYSRLCLLDTTRRWRRMLLAMIVVVAVVVHPVSVVLETVPVLPEQDKHHVAWMITWSIWQRIRPFIFLTEDVIISSLYVKGALEFMRAPRPSNSSWLSVEENRQVVLLISMQAAIWILDLAVIGCTMAKLFILVELAASPVYALKLSLEFVFLTQLVAMSGAARSGELLVINPAVEQLVSETVTRSTMERRETSELSMEQAYVLPPKMQQIGAQNCKPESRLPYAIP